jgi:NADP-dependent 3-hydroxy acid dehydrogenase YdfG
MMRYMLMANVREEEWEQTVRVNCDSALNCVGAVLPGMLSWGRGHIVTISSDAGRKVFPGLAVYSASKFFVEGQVPGSAAGDRPYG